MRSVRVLCLLVLLFTSSAFGQQESRQDFGVGLEHLIEPEAFRWDIQNSSSQRVVSERFYHEGMVVKLLTTQATIVIANVGLNTKAKRFEVVLLIGNEGKRPLDVLPQNVALQVPTNSKFLKPISSEKIAQEIEKKARSQAGWMMAGAWLFMRNRSVSTSETQGTISGNASAIGPGGVANGTFNSGYSESTTTRTTSPNYQAQQWAYERSMNQVEQARAEADEVRKAALLGHTVAPNSMTVGMLFFEYDKNAKEVIVKVRLGRDVYEIPFHTFEMIQ